MIESLIKNSINNNLFKVISKCADKNGVDCYVIGGYVRDLLMGLEKPKDIDILVVGDGIQIAKNVSKKLNTNSKVKIYKKYPSRSFIIFLNFAPLLLSITIWNWNLLVLEKRVTN